VGVFAVESESIGTTFVTTTRVVFFDTGSLDLLPLDEHRGDDLGAWPEQSLRSTTSLSAQALEAHTEDDPEPRLPDVVINDGLGL
jgi:hypothetical protein